MKKSAVIILCIAASMCLIAPDAAARRKAKTTQHDGYVTIEQKGAPTLGYSPQSGVQLIEKDGYLFKDMSRTGQLLPYEDWRLSYEERAADLAQRMTMEQIAGLMLYSDHQSIPAIYRDISTYDGKPYQEGVTKPWALSDHQRQFLSEDNMRHVLITSVQSPEIAARWNNEIQAFVEGLPWAIPANNSSDPRHNARCDSEFNAGGGGEISMWPGPLGMGATFSPELVKEFGRIASIEYRALGFATALSPQIDLGTEPRWLRFNAIYSSHPWQVADYARAYCDGFQTTYNANGTPIGWGNHSVNAMIKHWPGGGPCESGRDAHYGNGKYAVYPGGNFNLHKMPFTEGAFDLEDGTSKAAAVMPYYTISTGQGSEAVGNSYNADLINGQLRGDADFDGVVCTDWMITAEYKHPGIHHGKPWGVEDLTVAERHYKALMAGVDQFGGNFEKQPVLDAFEIGVKEHGREFMEQRMRQSAKRLLLNIFRTGLFENPYLDPAQSAAVVGCPEFMSKGYDAQLRSVVMLKNHEQTLPITDKKTKVYIPRRVRPCNFNYWADWDPDTIINPVTDELANRYFTRVDSPEEADAAIVFIDSPMGGWGYSLTDVYSGPRITPYVPHGNGYHPISLQYSDYIATTARDESLAGGDPFEAFTNRTYKGKSATTLNRSDMILVQQTRAKMGSKPVIVVVNVSNPPVLSEIEPYADALLFTFDIQNQAVMDILSGEVAPTGRLPFQVPQDMLTVEAHCEDTPFDITPYTDGDANTYNYSFGLTYPTSTQPDAILPVATAYPTAIEQIQTYPKH